MDCSREAISLPLEGRGSLSLRSSCTINARSQRGTGQWSRTILGSDKDSQPNSSPLSADLSAKSMVDGLEKEKSSSQAVLAGRTSEASSVG